MKPRAEIWLTNPYVSRRRGALLVKSHYRIGQDEPLKFSGVTIPTVGVPVDSLAASVRSLFPRDWRNDVSGEFTANGTQLTLRLWLNGDAVFAGTDRSPDAVNRLIDQGAFSIIEKVQPLAAVAALRRKHDLAAAKAAAYRVIETSPKKSDIISAHLLRGMIALEQKRFDDVIYEHQVAMSLEPQSATPHNNLCLVLLLWRKMQEAAAECREAIRLEPTEVSPHTNLGNVLHAEGMNDDAIVEYRRAIHLDRTVQTHGLFSAISGWSKARSKTPSHNMK